MTYPFIPAAHFTPGRNNVKPRLVIIHTMECGETVGKAKQVWNWFSGKTAPQASAHYCLDSGSTVYQNVLEKDTAWSVDDWVLNTASISLELAGSASQTPAQWADAYSQSELAVAAKLVADICKRNSIPVVKLSPADILAGKAGIAGHIDISIAKAIKGGHTDPGKNFPWVTFIAQVKAIK